MYCETIEGWFYASKKNLNVTAPDNGGKPVSLSLTYKKAINDVTDNAVVLKICGKLAESMAVPYNRVTDAYGGFFGNPSPSLPSGAATTNTAAATTNATKTNTTRMLNTTTNTTAAKQTEWKLNLFVQPDPFAASVKNEDTVKAATNTAALAAVNSVTKTSHGELTAASMAATAVTQAAVKFVKAPTSSQGTKAITITGSTDVAGYVYCGVSKTGTRRILNTTNSSNATTAATTTAATTSTEVVELQSKAAAAKFTI
jgi:hypothetical protein